MRVNDKGVSIGIDVGGPAKGFHAVALRGRELIDKRTSSDAPTIARWCCEIGAQVVAVDAPCHWRRPGAQTRLAERALAAERISCFSTPTIAQAQGHAFYTWMLAGAELFAALKATHPLYDGSNLRGAVSLETFPQAVACALAGQIVSAKKKVEVRSALLKAAEINPDLFANIDEIDAALCALAADSFARDRFKAYGDAEDGFVVVPAAALPSFRLPAAPDSTQSPHSALSVTGSTALATILELLPKLSIAERSQLASHFRNVPP